MSARFLCSCAPGDSGGLRVNAPGPREAAERYAEHIDEAPSDGDQARVYVRDVNGVQTAWDVQTEISVSYRARSVP